MAVQNSIALVTGANRGIGRALVQALLEAGAAKVYAAARNPDQIETGGDDRIVALKLDVTDPDQVAAAAGRASDVTHLFNNAGVADFGDPFETSMEEARKDMEVNYFAVLSVSRAFAPIIERNGGGAIINLASIVALAAMPGAAIYSASKAAVASLTQSLRGLLAPKGISVHGVFPGPIDTDMAKPLDMDKTSPEDTAREIISAVDQGAEDIFPDPMSKEVYAGWRQDHKAAERAFAGGEG